MDDRGLATRSHELTASLIDLEEPRMSNELAYIMNGDICFALWDNYLVIRVDNERASKLVGDDPHAPLFDLNHKTKKDWVMIATDALGEEDNLRNYIDIAMSFTFAFPPKPQNRHRKERGAKLINSA